MKQYRQHSEEFKRNLIHQIDSGAITKAAAIREHNIAPSLLERWRKQVHEGTLKHMPSAREKQLERELDQYKKKVGELSLQVDLLKKVKEYSLSLRRSNGYIVTGRNLELLFDYLVAFRVRYIKMHSGSDFGVDDGGLFVGEIDFEES